MKVIFFCNSGANIHSCRKEVLDLEKDFGITDEDWLTYSEEDRQRLAEDWANDRLEIGYEEIE